MSDIITELRRIIQDLVTPDLKAVQAEQKALAKQMELQHQVTMTTLEAFRAEMRSEMAMLRATNQMEVTRAITPVSERVAKLEATR